MACGAVFGSGFVEKDRLAFHHAGVLVASRAAHVAMHALKREGGAGIVIEQRRLPLGTVVAVGARRRAICFGELRAMNIGMAAFTAGGRGFEVGIHQFGFKIRRFVAIDAGHGAMRSDQWESGFGMVEAREFFPGFSRVASLASGG